MCMQISLIPCKSLKRDLHIVQCLQQDVLYNHLHLCCLICKFCRSEAGICISLLNMYTFRIWVDVCTCLTYMTIGWSNIEWKNHLSLLFAANVVVLKTSFQEVEVQKVSFELFLRKRSRRRRRKRLSSQPP